MASDRQPRTKAGKAASSSSQLTPHTILDEGPTDITKRLSTTEKTQRLLRILSANISENKLINPVTGGNPTNFVLGIVKSTKSATRRWFWDMPVILVEADSQYIDPPRKEGKKQSPIMASYFVFGDRLPETLASDPKLSPFIHEGVYLKFELPEGGKPFYLFPVEGKITAALQRISTPPPPPIKGVSEEQKPFVNVSPLSRYCPHTIEEARRILVSHEVVGGAPLDIDRIHDSLEIVDPVKFSKEDEKTAIPLSVLTLSGGAKFHLFSYGKYPPDGEAPQGSELILSEDKYYLIMPESVAKLITSKYMAQHLIGGVI